MARLTNYSQFYLSSEKYRLFKYSSLLELTNILKEAKRTDLAVRHIGSSHSLSTCNLPIENEILLISNIINPIRSINKSTIRVDASARLWDIQRKLSAEDLELPVINGGDASPTVGGFISAGGIGKTEPGKEMAAGRSCIHGGFWENVTQIRYLDGKGILCTSNPNSSDFKYLFGSRGQFGIFIDADLKIVPTNSNYFDNMQCGVENAASEFIENKIRTLWITFFVSPKQELLAWSLLEKWYLTYRKVIRPVDNARWAGPVYDGAPIGFVYDISYKSFNPPLVYSKQSEFKALGIAFTTETGNFNTNKLLAFAMKNIYDCALRNSIELYSSVENIVSSYSARLRYNESILNAALSLREKNHCSNFLNNGWFDFRQKAKDDLVSFF